MNVLFIMNGIGSVKGVPGISGGDVRWIEIAKIWKKEGWHVHVLTSEAGVKLCRNLGLNAYFHVNHAPEEYSLGTYLLKFLKAGFVPKTLDNYKGVIYSTTEHVYDALPALKIKRESKNIIWVAVVHWIAPMKRTGTNLINSILFFLNQRLGLNCIKRWADLVFAVSDNTLNAVRKSGINRNLFAVNCGVAYQEIRQIAENIKRKQYDAIFMKRFDGTKGVFDVIEIWKNVVKVKPDTKLAMIGLGAPEVMDKLRRMIEKYAIKKNVEFLGPIYDFKTKISILASAKLFILPSYEENWGIVIGEAMAAGVPVLCYYLPDILSVWEDKVVWIPKGDKKEFANKIIELLDDEQARNRLSDAGIRFVKKYDWQRIAADEIKLISSISSNTKL